MQYGLSSIQLVITLSFIYPIEGFPVYHKSPCIFHDDDRLENNKVISIARQSKKFAPTPNGPQPCPADHSTGPFGMVGEEGTQFRFWVVLRSKAGYPQFHNRPCRLPSEIWAV
ncbi:hypothetical protein EDC01DRAFT_64672 [Geopyxis carbonaria]|nr:hypothetical protein EDC01DRAFT_64672 [Geopyxis carbonaria]